MGAGVGMIKVATPVLIQEISHPRLRAILGSCYQTNAYIGIFFAALMTCKFEHGTFQFIISVLLTFRKSLVFTFAETGAGASLLYFRLLDRSL